MEVVLVINLAPAKARRANRNGRTYLVAPVTMMVSGVLNGSHGPLYYPPDEVEINPSQWNDIPIVVYHPTLHNRPVSGRDPEVLDKQKIGRVYNAQAEDGRLWGEGWFDAEKTKQVDCRVYDALIEGRPIGVSTGVYTSNEPVVKNNNRWPQYRGRDYHWIARNYRPDHLAVLPDKVGACSIKDGCGIHVRNEDGSSLGYALTMDEFNPDLVQLTGGVERVVVNEESTWLIANALPDMSPEKACKILHDGEVHGHPLTDAQRRMFGALCGQRKDNQQPEEVTYYDPNGQLNYNNCGTGDGGFKEGNTCAAGGGSKVGGGGSSTSSETPSLAKQHPAPEIDWRDVKEPTDKEKAFWDRLVQTQSPKEAAALVKKQEKLGDDDPSQMISDGVLQLFKKKHTEWLKSNIIKVDTRSSQEKAADRADKYLSQKFIGLRKNEYVEYPATDLVAVVGNEEVVYYRPFVQNRTGSDSGGHWVTLDDDQKIFIGGDGRVYPSGPGSQATGAVKGSPASKELDQARSGARVQETSQAPGGSSGRSEGPGAPGKPEHADTRSREEERIATQSTVRTGDAGVSKPDEQSGKPVEGKTDGPTGTGADREGNVVGKSAGDAAAKGVSGDKPGAAATAVDKEGNKATKPETVEVARDIGDVNKRLDRYERFFEGKGQHETANLMRMLRDHVNTVGTDQVLKDLGPVVSTPRGPGGRADQVQYWGVGTEEANWKNMGHFMEAYLARNGIKAVTADVSNPNQKMISALGKPDKFAAGDFKPAEMHFKDKLTESKSLPGLKTSEDVSKLMGKPVTHLTPEVTQKLDQQYGQGQWIVKSYGDEAAAGYGIFFPQRAAQIQQNARNDIWESGSTLAKYGFNHLRDADGKVVGIKHKGGDEYKFGTERYEKTIQGDARAAADKARAAADHEKGAMLPEGSFMAQPAFKAVGISDAERAAGRTWHAQNEGRVHLVTKPDGSVEVVPFATWLKGGNLPAVFKDDHIRGLEKAAKETIEQIPLAARKGQVYAPDVMKTADGYRVVELNAQGDFNGSGYLHDNHFTIDAYTSHLTGRAPAHAQFIHSLLAGKKLKNNEEFAIFNSDDTILIINKEFIPVDSDDTLLILV